MTIELEENAEGTSSGSSNNKLFLLQNSKSVFKTDAGEMRVMKINEDQFLDRRMQIGFITMEPRSLFIPQYLDSNLIIFIRRGIRYSLSLSLCFSSPLCIRDSSLFLFHGESHKQTRN